jgi:hypothetical protein
LTELIHHMFLVRYCLNLLRVVEREGRFGDLYLSTSMLKSTFIIGVFNNLAERNERFHWRIHVILSVNFLILYLSFLLAPNLGEYLTLYSHSPIPDRQTTTQENRSHFIAHTCPIKRAMVLQILRSKFPPRSSLL